MSTDAWDLPVECSDCGHFVDRDTIDPETGQCQECAEDTDEQNIPNG